MNTTTQTFIVRREGKIDKKLSAPEKVPTVEELTARVKLQMKMFRYDMVHRTTYRKTYNRLLADKRNKAFEKEIGLTRG